MPPSVHRGRITDRNRCGLAGDITVMTRLIGVDYGTKRIGLAVGDTETRLASPLAPIETGATAAVDAEVIRRRADDYAADAFVVGLPLNMDDSEGMQAKLTRSFGDELARICKKPVHFFDERLSTFAADELMRGADLTHKGKKRRKDGLAAQIILQGYIDAQALPSSREQDISQSEL